MSSPQPILRFLAVCALSVAPVQAFARTPSGYSQPTPADASDGGSTHSVAPFVAPPSPTRDRKKPPEHRAQALVVAGSVMVGSGLLSTAIGLGVFGGIHAGNPGPGLSLEGDQPEVFRLLRLARAMQGLGLAGIALSAAGGIALGIGIARGGAGSPARAARRSRLVIAPGPATLVVRF